MKFLTKLLNWVEKEKELGGIGTRLQWTLDGSDVQAYLAELTRKVYRHPLIHVYTDARIIEATGYVGNFVTKVQSDRGLSEIKHGAVVIAVGAEEYRPTEYLYGENEKNEFLNKIYIDKIESKYLLLKSVIKPGNNTFIVKFENISVGLHKLIFIIEPWGPYLGLTYSAVFAVVKLPLTAIVNTQEVVIVPPFTSPLYIYVLCEF